MRLLAVIVIVAQLGGLAGPAAASSVARQSAQGCEIDIRQPQSGVVTTYQGCLSCDNPDCAMLACSQATTAAVLPNNPSPLTFPFARRVVVAPAEWDLSFLTNPTAPPPKS